MRKNLIIIHSKYLRRPSISIEIALSVSRENSLNSEPPLMEYNVCGYEKFLRSKNLGRLTEGNKALLIAVVRIR